MAALSKSSLPILLLILLGAIGWYAKESSSTCMVAVKNAEATMMISGLGSSAECEEIVRRNRDWYVRQSPPDGGVLCEVQRGRKRYVVRDRGVFMLIGRGMCLSLEKQASSDR